MTPVKFICSLFLLLFSLSAIGNQCPGFCVNVGPDAMYDGLCKSAGEVRGKVGCEKYAQFGCQYEQKREVTIPGSCVNLGNNSMYDQLCSTSGQVGGQQRCQKYAEFGCTWNRPQVVCR